MIKKVNLASMFRFFKKSQSFNFAQSRLSMGISLLTARSIIRADENHFVDGVQWLENISSIVNFEGVPHSFNLLRGWEKPYPETSGYIVGTLVQGSSVFSDYSLSRFAKRIATWLITIQSKEGYYSDLRGEPQIFDTGQIIIGLCHIYCSGLSDTCDAINKGSLWLLRNQNDDGSFTKFSYHKKAHTYYSRVGAALIFAGLTLNNKTFIEAGIKNLDWVVNRQAKNGWIDLMSFDGEDPYSHNIMYTAEGLLAGYLMVKDDRYLTAVLNLLTPIADCFKKRQSLPARFDANFVVTDKSVCVTGLAQWCCLCQRLEGFDFKKMGDTALETLKSYQLISANRFLNGALPGSVPFQSDYMRFALPNWGEKFFLDALILANSLKVRPAIL